MDQSANRKASHVIALMVAILFLGAILVPVTASLLKINPEVPL